MCINASFSLHRIFRQFSNIVYDLRKLCVSGLAVYFIDYGRMMLGTILYRKIIRAQRLGKPC